MNSALDEATTAVVVTGSNGFVGSWMVRELLEQGYTVHACVRDASDPKKVDHLRRLEGAQERLKLFSTGDLGNQYDWEDPLRGSHAVFHTSMAMGWNDGRNAMYNPTLEGTRQLLQAIERYRDTIKTLILTSSTSAVAVQAEGTTDETHWRNAEEDINMGSWYSATKIAQEELATQWARKQGNDFRFVSICPTRVMGPPIQNDRPIEGWLNQLREWLHHPPSEENETIEFVHAQDVARLHTAALENSQAQGRFLCVDESWHWNQFLDHLKQLHPQMPQPKTYQGHEVPPKQYSSEKRNSLLPVRFRSMAHILQEAVEYLRGRGELGEFATI